ncbi:MAG TPA: adenylate/guanylate cyclase domain-containing protein [Solirubrobacteraceae bacterium]|jgi:pimeloyl-ACP methyl ester carboxylesterase|nr:adenylate/guanylate cyclase domain-containing protein [Solirubrobacteraceae bacterium]
MSAPATRYALSGDVSIAYHVTGDGPLDLLFLPGWISQIEHLWESPAVSRFLQRLSLFSRLILFDRRGTGLSERIVESQSLETDVRDALAVLDAAGSERAALLAYAQGGTVAARLAAEHPQRVGALVMYAAITRMGWAPDYDWALKPDEREELTERNIATWGDPAAPALTLLAPSMATDPGLGVWFARMQRLAASPAEARMIFTRGAELDVRDALADITVPTLVLHRREDTAWDVRHSLYIAEHVPGARYVELDGKDSFPFVGDSDAIVEEVEEFLTGGRTSSEPARALLTVMFTDIVDATQTAARIGDGRWRDLLAQHDIQVRVELARFAGREVKTVGDGFLAVFDGPPSRGLRCALAIRQAARELGIEVRVGMHTGECELIGEDVGGMAVHIAARVLGLAGPGEIYMSGTVFGTVVGGPFSFEDMGSHELKGVPGRWPVFSLSGGVERGY